MVRESLNTMESMFSLRISDARLNLYNATNGLLFIFVAMIKD